MAKQKKAEKKPQNGPKNPQNGVKKPKPAAKKLPPALERPNREQKADVLLLYFAYSDIPELAEERRKVQDAFKGKGFEVLSVQIPMVGSWEALSCQLSRFLSVKGSRKIIYYHGHGGVTSNQLYFTSNRITPLREPFQKPACIGWLDIGNVVRAAECDVLVILDCCASGAVALGVNGAMFGAIHADEQYAKEVIYATHWNLTTTNKMSPALCEALARWDKGLDPVFSANRLYREMSTILGNQRAEVDRRLKEADRGLEQLMELGGLVWTQQPKRASLEKERERLKWQLDRFGQPGIYEMHKSWSTGMKERFFL